MIQRMKNYLHISVDGVDLETASGIEFYLRQSNCFMQYTPEVISPTEMIVEIPYEDAMKLGAGSCRLQFALTDDTGTPVASDVQTIPVDVLLKEAGYAPI